MSKQDILARANNLSRRTHSHSWDKEGYLTVTTEVLCTNVQRSETFQNVYKCDKTETDTYIRLARAEATDIFLAAEEAPVEAPAPVVEAPAVVEEKPKRRRASRAKKAPVPVPVVEAPVPVVEEAPIHIAAEVAAEVAAEDDGLGDLEEAHVVKLVNYTKGDKLHSKILGTLLVSAYGAAWQKDEKVKVVVRKLVSAIKDTVPVVDSEGNMLESFPTYVAEFLQKAA